LRSKGQEDHLEQGYLLDETSILKPMHSQQVKSEKTNRMPQQIKSDATPLSPDRTISFEITFEVTHGDDYVANIDIDDDED